MIHSVKGREYEVIREGGEEVLKVNAGSWPYSPSIEENPLVMVKVIDYLAEIPSINRVVLHQRRNFNYSHEQTRMLSEIASIYNHITRQKKLLSLQQIGYSVDSSMQYSTLQYIVFNLLRSDPIGAYVELKRLIREENIRLESIQDGAYAETEKKYVGLLGYIKDALEKTLLIRKVAHRIAGHRIGDRGLYTELFRPVISPDFMYTQLMSSIPLDAEFVDSYSVSDSTVTILKLKNDIKLMYHVVPPEFKISDDEYELIDLARTVLAEHRPKEEEFLEPERLRRTFFNIGRDLLQELAEHKGYDIDLRAIRKLTKILVRYTIGFGMIEILLQDPKVQDVSVNSPVGQNPIYIVHADYADCVTNIIPSLEDSEGWATKFRLLSARPLDEANPILDTELQVPGARARVAVITHPLNPSGLAFSLRRHRDKPWTLPLFINNKMIDPLGAGLISFLIDGARTLLVAGTRSSGKCVDGNTLIQISDGNIIKIKDLIGVKKNTIEDGYIYEPRLPCDVLTLNNFSMQHSPISDVWMRTSPGILVKVKTRSGKEIITTPEHPYFTYNKGMQHIRADKLEKGKLIAIPRKIQVKGTCQFIDLSKEEYCRGIMDDFFILKGKTNSQKIRFPREITEELAEFLGLVIGDGHLDHTKLEFHNTCIELREKYKSFLKMFHVNYREFVSNTSIAVQANSRILCKVLCDYFEIPFGRKADKVVIPRLILRSPDNILACFLRGYFDTDGYIPKGKRDIELVSASEIMVKQLSLALLRYGVICFTKKKIVNNTTYHRLLIRGAFVHAFGEHIGFSHPFKKERLNSLLAISFLENTNVDIVPCGNEIIAELRQKLRISPKKFRESGKDCWAYENNEYRVSRNWFKKIVAFYKERHNELIMLKNKINVLRSLSFHYEGYVSSLEKIRSLLGISYITLASEVKLSDSGVRRILQKRGRASFETLQKLQNARQAFNQRITELSSLLQQSNYLENLPVFVKNGFISYAGLSRTIGVSETTLKSYTYGGINAPGETIKLIENELISLKGKLLLHLQESHLLLHNLNINLPTYIQVGIIMGQLRSTLHVRNEELVSENVCLMTVSNFFNGVYTCDFNVVQSIANKLVEIYNSSINPEILELLQEAEKLASSDIFWDEISHSEFIPKVDEFVYDLTVENTHNFIANGVVAHNTSLLGSFMVEIMRKYRVITLEDTLEMPIDALRKLGYNIQSMKVRSALTTGGTEIPADEGIRTSLRLGDSSLIVGEVRSQEAKALYEAMRIGALANVVAGTIHGDSPYGVFDRVVNDLGVPRTSFKATDIIVIVNPVKSGDGLHSVRRVRNITEVRKHWNEDPLREGGFVDLMKYDAIKDSLEPTDALINGESETLKTIAGNVRELVGNWDAIWDNILLRAKMKKTIVDYANKTHIMDLLEAPFVVASNDEFHKISDTVRGELGTLDSKRIFFEWEEWMKREIKKRRFS